MYHWKLSSRLFIFVFEIHIYTNAEFWIIPMLVDLSMRNIFYLLYAINLFMQRPYLKKNSISFHYL